MDLYIGVSWTLPYPHVHEVNPLHYNEIYICDVLGKTWHTHIFTLIVKNIRNVEYFLTCIGVTIQNLITNSILLNVKWNQHSKKWDPVSRPYTSPPPPPEGYSELLGYVATYNRHYLN